jgi:hypothetical protein
VLRHPRSLSKILLALLLVAFVGAGCGGDDDDSSSDSKTTTTKSTDEGSSNTTEDTAPLSPEEAREEGNPETYARIEGLKDCDALTRERDAAKANAETRKDNPRRVSILESYAEAAEDRMDELDCKS